MSEQRSSCCGPADEATPEPAKPAETTKGAAHDPKSPERARSGLLRAVRRMFGHVPA